MKDALGYIEDAPPFVEDAPRMEIVPVNDFNSYGKDLVISTPEINVYAGQQLTIIKGIQEEIKAHHKSSINLAHLAHKEAKKAQDKFLKPLEEAEVLIKKCLTEYNGEVQAKGISVRRKVKVIIKDASLIPENLLEVKPNLKAIQAVIDAGGTVPGVESEENVTISARAVK